MNVITKRPKTIAALAMIAVAVPGSLLAQQPVPVPDQQGEVLTTVYGSPPSDLEGLTEGPEVEGFISSRRGDELQVTTIGGANTVVRLSEGTQIRASGGFLGLDRDALGPDSLLNGPHLHRQSVEQRIRAQ